MNELRTLLAVTSTSISNFLSDTLAAVTAMVATEKGDLRHDDNP